MLRLSTIYIQVEQILLHLVKHSLIHRLNMELDLQSLFGLHVMHVMCTAALIS
jgi:hypothetical protein